MPDQLSPTTRLQCAPDLLIGVAAPDHLELHFDGRKARCPHHALAILETLRQPTRFADALKQLASNLGSMAQWQETVALIGRLHSIGALREVAEEEPAFPYSPLSHEDGYDAPGLHVSMMQDRVRMDALLNTIRETIQPGDIVVEIGTGIGLNAIEAIKAGAKHVYAIEMAKVGQCAPSLFEANDVHEQVTYLHGDIQDLTLPEKADVLICDITTKNPLNLYPFAIYQQVRKQFLKPDSRVIPQASQVMALPLDVPEDVLRQHTFMPAELDQWNARYGMDFSPLAAWGKHSYSLTYLSPTSVLDWTPLADPVCLARSSYLSDEAFAETAHVEATAHTAGRLTGLLLYLQFFFSASHTISNHPHRSGRQIVWQSPLYLNAFGSEIAKGDTLAIGYRYAPNRDKIFISGAARANGGQVYFGPQG